MEKELGKSGRRKPRGSSPSSRSSLSPPPSLGLTTIAEPQSAAGLRTSSTAPLQFVPEAFPQDLLAEVRTSPSSSCPRSFSCPPCLIRHSCCSQSRRGWLPRSLLRLGDFPIACFTARLALAADLSSSRLTPSLLSYPPPNRKCNPTPLPLLSTTDPPFQPRLRRSDGSSTRSTCLALATNLRDSGSTPKIARPTTTTLSTFFLLEDKWRGPADGL